MGDCLLALQQCSLIGLDDSPQLLRRSMLASGQQTAAPGSPAQQLDFNAAQGSTQPADGIMAPTVLTQQEAAATPASDRLAAMMQAAAGGRPTATWLDCSLPLLASDSPAIAGMKPPRSRFRRAAAPASPAATGPATGNTILAAAAATLQQPTGRADATSEAAPAMLTSIDATTGTNDCTSVPKKSNEFLDSEHAQTASDTYHDADCNAGAALPEGLQHSSSMGWQPKGQPANWNLLQHLLDDSSCSSLSCLPSGLGLQSPAAAATPAAALQQLRRPGLNSPAAGGAPRELTRSVGSDITGFRGFWSATPGGRSAADFSPAPVGQDPSARLHEGAGNTPSAAHAGSAGAATSAAAALEAADAGNVMHQRNTALMMLLSLDDSMVLHRASCGQGSPGVAAQQWQRSPISEAPDEAQVLESPTPTAATAVCAEPADVASPDQVPTGQLLLQQDWTAAGVQATSARYTADCWPSPDGSPGVLLSSPVLVHVQGEQGSPAVTSTKTLSRVSPAAAAAPTGELQQQSPAPQQQADGQQGQGSPAGQGAAGGDSIDAALRVAQQPNTLQYSPIRGLTLWNDTSIPDAAQQLAAAAGPHTGLDSPVWGQQQQPQPQQHDTESSTACGSGSCTPATSSVVANQFEQLQALLTSSSSSSIDWCDASPSSTLAEQGAAVSLTPQGQAQLPLAQQPQQQPVDVLAARDDAAVGSASHSPATAALQVQQQPQQEDVPLPPPPSPALHYCQLRQQAAQSTTAASTPSKSAAASPAAARSSSAATTPTASGTATMTHLQLRASPAESMDSFYGAAAGEPYGGCMPGAESKAAESGSVRRSLSWQAYEGLGALLDGEQPNTPGSVMCRKAWSSSGGAADSAAACTDDGRHSSNGHPAQGECEGPGTGRAGDGVSPAAAVANLNIVVSLLKQQLREAELRCTQQQMSVNEARQLVMQKELEVERLRAGLVRSEQEGTGCLEALEAALDIMTAADGGTDAGSTAAEECPVPAAAVDTAGQEALQLHQQCQVLQLHNAELQSTLAEAGQQLDIFEAQLQQLGAEKVAVEQQLAALQQQLSRQKAEHEAFLQSELDEQQQQHEEEVRQLHDRLDELHEQMQTLRDAAAASKAAAEQSQAKAASLQRQLLAREEHAEGLQQQLEHLQAVLHGQESESAASSEQLSRQVAQLLAAQQELQAANARLLEAEAEYASNQLALGCRNQELSKQLEDALSGNKRLGEANQQLQAQNASLSQMMQSMRASVAAHSSAAPTEPAATPTASTAQSCPPQSGPAASAAAAAAAVTATTATSGMEGPTPMRRRMASVNAQLERRVQELLQQKQALAAQVEQLQEQLGQQPPMADAKAGLSEQQQAAAEELQQQVEHLTTCNDELVHQLEELDWAHEQLQAERLELQGRLAELEQERSTLMGQLQELQQRAEAGETALAAAADAADAAADVNKAALQQQVQQLQTEKEGLSQQCQQLQDKLAMAQQQLHQAQEEHALTQTNTALFERCKELKLQVQQLQQELQQREAQSVRSSVDAGQRPPVMPVITEEQQQAVEALQGELQQLEQRHKQQQQQHRVQEAQLQGRCQQLAVDLSSAQQQLTDLQGQLQEADGSRAQLSAECDRLRLVAADAEAGMQAAQEALSGLKARNKSLVDQLVQLQLATPAPAHAGKTVTTVDRAAQTADDAAAVAGGGPQRSGKRRWTLDTGVQVELGSTDAEQATAVQQLLLLQAQAQLHEMEEQNRQAAQRHVEAKQRLAQLQSSLAQQEAALHAAEQQVRDAKQNHSRESAGLQRENEQLVRQLADTRVQLQVLQTANAHLEGRVKQQQEDLQQQAAAAKEARLKVQELTHQQHLDKLQVAAVTAELTACKDHMQQLMVAQEKEARAVAMLQQKLQQAQQDGQKAAATAVATSRAAYSALEERLAQEVRASREQVEHLLQEKNALLLELQQTKATVDCLEDSVRRLGQHNAHLVQQIKDSFKAADSSSTGAGHAISAAAAAGGGGAAAAMATPTSAPAGSFHSSGTATAGAPAREQSAAGTVGPLSPRTLHGIIAAATRVNEKNKKLKRQLQLAMQGVHGA